MSIRSSLIFSTTILIISFVYMYKDEKRFIITPAREGIYVFDTKTQRVNLCDDKKCYIVQPATPAFMPSYYRGIPFDGNNSSLDGGIPYGMCPMVRPSPEIVAADTATPNATNSSPPPAAASSSPSYESKYYNNVQPQY